MRVVGQRRTNEDDDADQREEDELVEELKIEAGIVDLSMEVGEEFIADEEMEPEAEARTEADAEARVEAEATLCATFEGEALARVGEQDTEMRLPS